MAAQLGDAPLYRWEKWGLVLFGIIILAFGVITEIRSAFLSFRHTDFNCYTHAGWAIRHGDDVYGAVATNGLIYTYPCTFAFLMVPFAESPPWIANPEGIYLPYSVSVGIWYLLSVGFAIWSVHALASAILPDAKRGTRRWWYARTVPFYVCIGGIGFTLGRGQVNVMLVAMFTAAFVAAIRGRRFLSGMWLGGAIAIKLIPAILLLFPLYRRDWRAGLGVAAALMLALGALPMTFWGLDKTLQQHEFFVRYVVLAGATGTGEQPMGKVLTETNATDSQSFLAAIHHIRHWDTPRELRPRNASADTRLAHAAISGLLILTTMIVAYRRLTAEPTDQLLFFGSLCALLMLVTPVSHMHFYAMVLPMVAGIWLRGLKLRPGEVAADFRTSAVLTAWGIATALPLFPGPFFERIRECGFGAAATVGLWAFGLRHLGRVPIAKPMPVPEPVRLAA